MIPNKHTNSLKRIIHKNINKFLFYDEFEMVNYLVKQSPILTTAVEVDLHLLSERVKGSYYINLI